MRTEIVLLTTVSTVLCIRLVLSKCGSYGIDGPPKHCTWEYISWNFCFLEAKVIWVRDLNLILEFYYKSVMFY